MDLALLFSHCSIQVEESTDVEEVLVNGLFPIFRPLLRTVDFMSIEKLHTVIAYCIRNKSQENILWLCSTGYFNGHEIHSTFITVMTY